MTTTTHTGPWSSETQQRAWINASDAHSPLDALDQAVGTDEVIYNAVETGEPVRVLGPLTKYATNLNGDLVNTTFLDELPEGWQRQEVYQVEIVAAPAAAFASGRKAERDRCRSSADRCANHILHWLTSHQHPTRTDIARIIRDELGGPDA